MKRFYVEGKSSTTGEVIYGSAHMAENKADAARTARTEYEGFHSRQACMKIDFSAWEQEAFIPKY